MTDEEKLRQYQDLLDSGVITQDEFNDMTQHLRARLQQKDETTQQDVPEENDSFNEDKSQSTVEETVDEEREDEPSAPEQELASEQVTSNDVVSDDSKKPIVLLPKQMVDSDKGVATDVQEQPEVQQTRSSRHTTVKKEHTSKPKKNHDLLIAIVIVLIVLIGGGVYVAHHSQENAQIESENAKQQSSEKASSSKSQKKAASAKSDKKKASSEKKSTPEKVPAQWSESQNAELANYMGIWQKAVGQEFVGTYNGDSPKHLDYKFPEALKGNQLHDHLKLDGENVKFTWSPKADKKADYQVVAVATGSRQGVDAPTSYFFVIHDGEGKVYATETASGKDLDLTETQNADLKNNFASIVNENQEQEQDTQEDVKFSDDATVTEY